MATLPLETDYVNPDVILTTRVTHELKNRVKYVKCGGLILITFFLSVYIFSVAIWGLLLTGVLWWGAIWYLRRRPSIVLDGRTREIQLSGITKLSKSQSIPIKLVEKITVMADVLGRERGQYIPQLVLKGLKGGGKKMVINCFPVEDIIQAHYSAQLLATFCRVDAFDYKGSQLPILSSYIPARFRVNQGETVKPTVSKGKKAKAQPKKADVRG